MVREWRAEQVVDAESARQLITEQFTDLEGTSIELLGEGWDNTVWLVDGSWVFRFPRRAIAVPAVERQVAVLPRLAPVLPLAIPTPIFHGRPAAGFPWPFYGAPFIPGREVANADLDDGQRIRLAEPLGSFLRALHSRVALACVQDAPLEVDPLGRADMDVRVPRTRERLAEAESLGLWTAPALMHELLDEASTLARPTGSAVLHGDLHFRHLLVGDGREAAGIVDWDDVCLGDPAIDLALYWCLVPGDGRPAFRDAYGMIRDEQLLRSRVLALFLCATLAVYGAHEGMPRIVREAVDGLERTATD